jgi:hypothetical protein
MPRTPIKAPGASKKKPQTIAAEIAANPSLFIVEARTHAKVGFEIVIYKSKETGRTANPCKAYGQSGFRNIDLAVRALIEFMAKVIEVDGTKFKAAHLTALTRRMRGKQNGYSIPLRDILKAVQ